jgi:hypothetical protein
MLVDNTTILAQASDKKRLQYLEAIFIIEKEPSPNMLALYFKFYHKIKLKRTKQWSDRTTGE